MARKSQIVLIVLVSLLAMAVVIGGFVSWVVKITGEPVKAVRAHLEAINQGNYALAYSHFSAVLQARMPLEEFQAFVEKYGAVMKTRDSSFPRREISNNTATVRGTLTGRQGQVSTVRYTLVKQGDRWLIQNFRLGVPLDEE